MPEYISQETAIKSTWMILEGMGYPRSENRPLERTVEAVFKSAPAADVVERPRWIPVTERLPEEQQDGFSEDVLMLVENPDGDITWKDVYVGYYLYNETSAETGWWAMMTCDCVKIGEHKYGNKVFPANEYVTHWMPLPEPPEEVLSGTKE